MPTYDLIEYSDNYSDTSGSLWQFKRDEIEGDVDLTVDNSSFFKYKSNFIGDTVADGANRKKEGVKIAVPLKYLSNFWRSLEMPLINCKVELSLKWYERCLLTVANTATFKITDAKIYVPIVTLSIEDNAKLSKLLSKGFKRPLYWNKYKIIFENFNANDYIRERIDANFQGVNKLFVVPYASCDNVTDEKSYKKYFLPRVKIEICNIEIDGRNFMISQLMTQLNNMAKLEKYQQHKGMIILLVVY